VQREFELSCGGAILRFRIICSESLLKSAAADDLVDPPVPIVVLVDAGDFLPMYASFLGGLPVPAGLILLKDSIEVNSVENHPVTHPGAR
jgi:hypothetical protein